MNGSIMRSPIRLGFRCQNLTQKLINFSSLNKICKYSSAASGNLKRKEKEEKIANSNSNSSEPLVLTDFCVAKLKRVAGENEMLRIIVEGGGCSGFEYKFNLVDHSNKDDVLIEKNGAKVVIDDLSLEYVRGSTLDYTEDLIKSSFRVIKNPNAELGCSCGASFALKTPKS